MKIKTDFVTNSSSSSFVVVGISMEERELPEDKIIEILEKHGLQIGTQEDLLETCIEDFTKGSDLTYSFGSCYDDGPVMVGICYTNMMDDETLAQFKARVKNLIKERFGVSKEPGHIEECWQDG